MDKNMLSEIIKFNKKAIEYMIYIEMNIDHEIFNISVNIIVKEGVNKAYIHRQPYCTEKEINDIISKALEYGNQLYDTLKERR